MLRNIVSGGQTGGHDIVYFFGDMPRARFFRFATLSLFLFSVVPKKSDSLLQ
jgi:hypothetical protein